METPGTTILPDVSERSIGAIQNFSELTCLDLSFNHLRNIPEELCALANLEYLNLSID